MKHILTALALASLLLISPPIASAQEVTTTASAPAPAKAGDPTLTVTAGTLIHGSTATITYSNPAKAGQTVVVTISNGMRRNPVTQIVEIQLDANGQGSANWVVPAWSGATFNSDGFEEIVRAIQ